MNGSIAPLWPSLLPPVCDQLWFTADYPKNEEAELACLEEELEQEKMQLREQHAQDCISIERNVEQPEEQDYDETEDDSYMGDANSDDVDEEAPQSPNYTFIP